MLTDCLYMLALYAGWMSDSFGRLALYGICSLHMLAG
jgi:hypothetical protein